MSEYTGGTDSVHKITLTSSIQVARWCVASAGAGESAPLEVRTHCVGDGAEVKITVRTRSGKMLGKTQAKIGRNLCSLGYVIPDSTREEVYFEAELPKHGLKARSGLLRVFPVRAMRNARWDKKEARRGDVVKLMADTSEIKDGTEVAVGIYEHDADGAHDLVCEMTALVKSKKIELEWQYEYHDDTDEIPTHEEAEKGYSPPEYFFKLTLGPLVAQSGLLTFKDWIEISLVDAAGNPAGNEKYVVKLPDGSTREGNLDANGFARLTDVPPGPCSVEFPGFK